MAATIIYDDQTSHVPNASADGDNLWIPVQDLRRATGWELKSEGACLGDQCVPIGQGRELETVSKDGAGFNLAAFARMLGQPVVHDDTSGVWVFGRAGADRQRKLLSLEAPDFSLPDLDGKMHSLSEHRGKKVFLVTWASW
jgi:hypothetical protein